MSLDHFWMMLDHFAIMLDMCLMILDKSGGFSGKVGMFDGCLKPGEWGCLTGSLDIMGRNYVPWKPQNMGVYHGVSTNKRHALNQWILGVPSIKAKHNRESCLELPLSPSHCTSWLK